MLAVLHVEEVWQADRTAEAKAVFNSTSIGVTESMARYK